jgi:PKD repeat protein
MNRLRYRNFGSHQSLVVNHSVTASGTVGIRWYEFRNPSGTPTVYQQGTFSPDSTYRWMGSIAMDQAGNIAMGYSASSTSLRPSIHYTGRLNGDALGQMTQGEGTIISGTGSQLANLDRWGDYSDLTIDPTDDCTFWYTTEYLAANGTFNWRTRIASFAFPSCSGAPGCNAPSGLNNNTAADLDPCADTGVEITWAADPSDWGDTEGTRTYDVLRNGVAIQSGIPYGTTSFTDNTAANNLSFTYSVRYNNGCGSSNTTSGASASDATSSGTSSETASQANSAQAKNNTVSAALSPGFTIGGAGATAANITWTLGGNTNLTNCVAVRLRAPNGTETNLKTAGQPNPGSANVLSFYQTHGAGTYAIVLQELSGCGQNNRNANISGTQLVVQQAGGTCGGNNPPNASFTFNCSGLTCSFTDTSIDTDGTINARNWQFGDGGSSTSQNPSHTYASGGTYSVTLTVTDNGSLQDSDSQDVTVSTGGGGGINLNTTGYKVKGVQHVDLAWSGATSGNVDIYRNGAFLLTTQNDGAHTDNIGVKGGGTYIYKVCEAGTSTCSNDSTVSF